MQYSLFYSNNNALLFNKHFISTLLYCSLLFSTIVLAKDEHILSGLRSLRNKAAKDMNEEQTNADRAEAEYHPGQEMSFRQPVDDSTANIAPQSPNFINKKSSMREYLYQGDILLNEKQLDVMLSDQGIASNEKSSKIRHKRQGTSDAIDRWTDGVYYSYAGSATEMMRLAFEMAINFWHSHTCVDFYESNSVRNRIEVFKGEGCYSYVGKYGGIQQLSLGDGCADVAIASHELGHALGFFHTHSRWDRDEYITVNTKNLDPDFVDQYLKESKQLNDNFGLPYDYGSIMHYDCTSSSVDGKQITMIAKDENYQTTMGSPIVSFYDILMMNIMYDCLDKCDSLTSASCINGGYPNPRNCSKCICPSAYAGPNCETIPSKCGKNLTADTAWERFNVSLRSNNLNTLKETDYLLPTIECDYWITSPADTIIEVIVRAIDLAAFTYGCTFGAVELKVGPDQNYTGIRVCMPKNGVNVVYRSTKNYLAIRVYNTIVKTKASISYRYVKANSSDIENNGPIYIGSDATLNPNSNATTTATPNPIIAQNFTGQAIQSTNGSVFVPGNESNCVDLLQNCETAYQLGFCTNQITNSYCRKTCGCH